MYQAYPRGEGPGDKAKTHVDTLVSLHSSRHGSSQEFPSLVHSICTSSAPALEMHSAQVLKMLAQRECPRTVQVLQEMLCIQECVQECVT